MRRTIVIFVLAGTLTPAAACGGAGKTASGGPASSPTAGAPAAGRAGKPLSGRTYQVRLEILGKGRLNTVYYHVDTDGRAADVALPWKQTQTVHGGTQIGLLASTTAGQKLTCRIVVNGKVADIETGGFVQCGHQLPR